jgi:nitroreductase
LADLDSNPSSPYKMIEDAVRSGKFNPFYNAPALVLITGDKNIRHMPADCGILTAYFMLSAAARGLGTCFAFQGTMIQDKDMLEELGITGDYRIYGSVIIGYPKAIPPIPKRKEPEYLKVIE